MKSSETRKECKSLIEFRYQEPFPSVTIRRSTDQERRDKFPPLVGGKPRIRVPKYVVVSENDCIYTVFGLPQGGDTRAEAVFWAERLASKNDLRYEPPAGWENVEGKLPRD